MAMNFCPISEIKNWDKNIRRGIETTPYISCNDVINIIQKVTECEDFTGLEKKKKSHKNENCLMENEKTQTQLLLFISYSYSVTLLL